MEDINNEQNEFEQTLSGNDNQAEENLDFKNRIDFFLEN